MRKTTFLIFFILLNLGFIYSCRKKVDRDLELANKPFHCFNNVLDGDEIIIDGGGSCGCADISIENYCGLTDNTVTLGSNSYPVASCTRDSLTSGIYAGLYEYTITLTNGGIIKIKTSPTVWYNSDLDNGSGLPDESEFLISINISPYSFTNLQGHIKIKTNGINYAVESCDGFVYYGFTTINIRMYVLYN